MRKGIGGCAGDLLDIRALALHVKITPTVCEVMDLPVWPHEHSLFVSSSGLSVQNLFVYKQFTSSDLTNFIAVSAGSDFKLNICFVYLVNSHILCLSDTKE